MSTPLPPASTAAPADSLVTITHVVYALHTLGLVIGAFGAASIIGMFVFGWPSIIAVIINYVKRSEACADVPRFSLLVADPHVLVGAADRGASSRSLDSLLAIVLIGFAIWVIGFFVLGIWAIYRIARGWLALMDRRPMPLPD